MRPVRCCRRFIVAQNYSFNRFELYTVPFHSKSSVVYMELSIFVIVEGRIFGSNLCVLIQSCMWGEVEEKTWSLAAREIAPFKIESRVNWGTVLPLLLERVSQDTSSPSCGKYVFMCDLLTLSLLEGGKKSVASAPPCSLDFF